MKKIKNLIGYILLIAIGVAGIIAMCINAERIDNQAKQNHIVERGE